MTRNRARVLLVLLFLTAKLHSCCAEFCNGPKKEIQNGDTFILRGPCPSDNPLFVPVNDSVLYQCDDEKPSGTYLPLWNISGLSGSPFLNDEGSEHSITVTEILPTDNTVNTTLNILVREQYLMEPVINIQCGLCLGSVCFGNDPLQENIISDPVILVAFSSPQSLTHHRDRDTVLLTWSSPVVASNYPVEFQYEVILINNNSQVITYNITNNTSLNISREDIPDDYHVCSQYYWSMRSVVGDRKSMIVQANETFSIPSAPVATSGLQVNITECMNDITILIQFVIISCQSPETLEYEVLISGDDDINITSSINYASTDDFEYSIQVSSILLLEMDQSLEDLLNESIAINITNDIGHDVTEYQILNNAELFGCPPSPSPSPPPFPPPPPPSPVSTLSTPFSTPSIIYSTVSSFSSVSSSTPPTIEAADPNKESLNVVPFFIVGVILFLFLMVIIIVIIFIYKRRKKKVDITNGTGKETINRNGDEMAGLVESTDSSKDSNTQITSDQGFRNLSEDGGITEDFVKLNPTYSTTEDIRKAVQQTVNNSEYAEVVQNSETKQKTLQQNEPITDTPGYSEPLSQVSGNPPEPTYSTPEHAIHHPPTLVSHVPRNTSPLHGVVDTPGYTEVPGPFKKTGSKRGSKRKHGSTKSPSRQGSMRSPKSPLPLLPTDVPPIPTMPTGALETDSNSNSHLYADIEEIKNKKHQGKNTTYVKLELSDAINPTPSSQQGSETPYSTIAKQT